jgi:hypothetical protein
MKTISWLSAGVIAATIALLSASQATIDAGQPAGGAVPVNADDVGGVVTGERAWAGVWSSPDGGSADQVRESSSPTIADGIVPICRGNNIWVRGYRRWTRQGAGGAGQA